MQFTIRAVAATAAIFCAASSAFAQQGETVKIVWIDPLSGLMASVGASQLRIAQFVAQHFNQGNAAGVKFEVIGVDNKLSAQETIVALRTAIDSGARYVLQGAGSGPALAIIDTLEKYNARNPGKEVLYLNYAAIDPDLTNSKCSYWQYRFDSDTITKMNALTSFIKDQPDVKKVYIIGQNYAHGQQVSKSAREYLKQKRPDIEIVGDDLAPLAQVRDFSPYVAKIKASGADAVITGNWGSDLTLLLRAANDAGLNARFYTYYTYSAGTPTAVSGKLEGNIYNVSYAHPNIGGDVQAVASEYKARFNDDMSTLSFYNAYQALVNAFVKTKSTDPAKVAAVMEGMKYTGFNGPVELRKADHQLLEGLYISRWEKVSAKYPYSPENTGYTLAPVKHYSLSEISLPTTCQMKRPAH